MNNKTKLYQCPAYLFCNYELLEKSSNQIAKECGVNSLTIRNWLKKFNIRIKTKSEAMKDKKKSEKTKKKMSKAKLGEKNPNYGKTGEKHPMYGKHWSEESKDKMRGKNNPTWKGNDVKNLSVNMIHRRIEKVKPKPVDGKCKLCHEVKDKKGIIKLVLSNLKDHDYTFNPDDYQWVHRSCHLGYDKEGSWTPERRKEQSERMKGKKIALKKPKIVENIQIKEKSMSQVSYWLN